MNKIVTLFYNKFNELNLEDEEKYAKTAENLINKAKKQKGFVSIKTFTAPDGERLTVSEFETIEDMIAWRDDPYHKEAKKMGQEIFYKEYRVVSGEVIYEKEYK